jgi:hypothetical protein
MVVIMVARRLLERVTEPVMKCYLADMRATDLRLAAQAEYSAHANAHSMPQTQAQERILLLRDTDADSKGGGGRRGTEARGRCDEALHTHTTAAPSSSVAGLPIVRYSVEICEYKVATLSSTTYLIQVAQFYSVPVPVHFSVRVVNAFVFIFVFLYSRRCCR